MIVAKIRGKHQAQEHVPTKKIETLHFVTELTHRDGRQISKLSIPPLLDKNGRSEENC